MAGRFQVQRRIRQCHRDITGSPQCAGDVDQPGKRTAQGIGMLLCADVRFGLVDGRGDPLGQQCQPGAVVHNHLAAQQVQAVDAVCAFVDGVETVVSVGLLDVELLGVAVAAVHLDGQAVGLQAPLRRPALGDRRQHLQQQVGAGAVGFGARTLLVDQAGAVQAQRQRTFDIGLLRQQHSLHVGVFDDGHLRQRRVLGVHRAALGAGLGVLDRGQVPGVSGGGGLQPDGHPRLVHHVEHIG